MLCRSRTRPALADGNRLGRLPRQVQPAYDHQVDRQSAEQRRGIAWTASAICTCRQACAPNVEQELTEFFHTHPLPRNMAENSVLFDDLPCRDTDSSQHNRSKTAYPLVNAPMGESWAFGTSFASKIHQLPDQVTDVRNPRGVPFPTPNGNGRAPFGPSGPQFAACPLFCVIQLVDGRRRDSHPHCWRCFGRVLFNFEGVPLHE